MFATYLLVSVTKKRDYFDEWILQSHEEQVFYWIHLLSNTSLSAL